MSIINEWTTTGWFDSPDDEWFPHLDDVGSRKYFVAKDKPHNFVVESKTYTFIVEGN